MIHQRTLSAILICVAGICYGGYLIWRGISGNVLRGRFTGDPVIPPWMYVAGGAALTAGSALMIVVLLQVSFP